MIPMLTFGDWLTSPGFGGLAAVIAATIAYLGVRRSSNTAAANARKDQWWDRLKWAVELSLSDKEPQAAAGLRALEAIMDTSGFDDDELAFITTVADVFLTDDTSGRLETSATGEDSAS